MRLKLVLNCTLPAVGLVVLATGSASAQTLELPRPRQGYFLSAGPCEPDADLEGVFGAGYMLGVSYDWFFSKHQLSGGWALTPSVAVRYVAGDPVQGMVGLFGLEFTYFSGRPANQLELPAGEGYKR